MGALLTLLNVRKTLIFISAITAILVFLATQETASATVPMADRHFDLVAGHDYARGVWGLGNKLRIVENDEPNERKLILVYDSVTGERGIWGEIWLADTTIKMQGIWTYGRTMWVADARRSDYGKLFAYNLNNGNRRPGKDVQLADFNLEPLSMWSDGTTVWVLEDSGNDLLYAYDMEPASNQVGQLAPYKSITLDSDNSDPRGTWSDGDTIWVSDSGDDKLYAYDLDDRSRDSGLEFDLHSNNDDPGEIWSDGEIVWVMDAEDKGAYAYELATGTRVRSKEFLTAPDNDNSTGGLTGHELRFWVADSDDEMLYAYGRLNASPTFTKTSASFRSHRTASAGDYVSTVPEAVDPDGESVIFMLLSGGLGVLQHDSQTGEIFLRDDFTGFSGGEEYTLTVAVTDGRSPLDGLSSDADDAINVTITGSHNADAEFTTEDGAVFTVAENVAEDVTIVQLETTDLDGDTLSYEMAPATGHPFQLNGGQIELAAGESLDYESRTYYNLILRVQDGKDEAGNDDSSWDDAIALTIQVTNVDKAGEITLNSAHPQVNTEIVATLTDPDGDALTYTLASGADSDLFSIDSTTGRLEVARERSSTSRSMPSLRLNCSYQTARPPTIPRTMRSMPPSL